MFKPKLHIEINDWPYVMLPGSGILYFVESRVWPFGIKTNKKIGQTTFRYGTQCQTKEETLNMLIRFLDEKYNGEHKENIVVTSNF